MNRNDSQQIYEEIRDIAARRKDGETYLATTVTL